MNGIHDMGGMDNMGSLALEASEDLFKEDWERVMFSNAVAVLGAGYCKLDEIRRATEWMPPVEYLRSPYYCTWLYAVCSVLLEKKLVTAAELANGHSEGGVGPLPALRKDMALFAMTHPIPTSVNIEVPARFKAGDVVVAKNLNTMRHTRLPRYARGRRGTVEHDQGVFLLPDTNAHGGPDLPQHVYSVRFTARELWGPDASVYDTVHIDLFEDYLEGQPA
jgi:nitrile hydratase subunit beta